MSSFCLANHSLKLAMNGLDNFYFICEVSAVDNCSFSFICEVSVGNFSFICEFSASVLWEV
jgi:hypothetical protein